MQHKDLLFSPGMSLVPIAMLLIFVGFYFTSQQLFVQCEARDLVTCAWIDTGSLAPTTLLNEAMVAQEPPLGYLRRLEKQYSGRMLWIFFAAANFLICLFVLGVFWLVASRWLGLWKASVMILISVLAGAFSSFFDPLFLAGPVFERTIQQAGWAGIENFATVNRFINTFSLSCAIALTLTVAAVLFAEDESSKKSSDGETIILANKRQDLKVILYASTASLVVGLLRLDQAFTWAVAFIPNEGIAAIPESFFSNVTGTLGGFYTLLLASIYVPAAFIIYARAKAVIGAGAVPDEWSANPFTFSFSETLPRVLAIAAPLLTGPIAEL